VTPLAASSSSPLQRHSLLLLPPAPLASLLPTYSVSAASSQQHQGLMAAASTHFSIVGPLRWFAASSCFEGGSRNDKRFF
jgi:hypothetical protein